MKNKPLFFLMVLCYFPVFRALAIITTNNTAAEQQPVSFNWDYVCKFNGSSAVAVDPYWLLTAAHVADDAGNSSVTINGQTYNQVGEVYHPTADLALIQLDRALPGWYSIYAGSYLTPTRARFDAIMVGYGVTGTVVDESNYTFGSTGKGTKRWGSNKIDGEINYTGGTGKSNSGIKMYFNTSDSVLEAGAGTGDSGGGVFLNDNGVWKLAGIMTDISISSGQDIVYAVDAQDYSSWIAQTVPEPTTAFLLAGFSLVFGIIKRMRYMYQ